MRNFKNFQIKILIFSKIPKTSIEESKDVSISNAFEYFGKRIEASRHETTNEKELIAAH